MTAGLVDLDRAVDDTRRALRRRQQLVVSVDALAVAAIGVAACAVYRAVFDPTFAWTEAGAAIAAAVCLVAIPVVLTRRIDTAVAARILDRRLAADGRVLTLRESSGGALVAEVRRETERLLAARPVALPAPPVGTRVIVAAGTIVGAVVFAIITPDGAGRPSADGGVVASAAGAGGTEAVEPAGLRALRRDVARSDPALANALDQAVNKAKAQGDREAPSIDVALDRAAEARRLGTHVDRALGDDPVADRARAALRGAGAGGAAAGNEGAAAAREDAHAIANRIDRAAATPEVSERIRALLNDVAAALREGRDRDRKLAAERYRAEIGLGEAPRAVVAEVERALKSGGERAKLSASGFGRQARPTIPDLGRLRDPELAAVVERYFRQVRE